MIINEVQKQTGLSKKAIRLYEEKGLIKVSRSENGYRDYSEDNIENLNKIKLLRMAGVSISDIKLLFGNFITIDELLAKREKEIENEYGAHSEHFTNCCSIFKKYENSQYEEKFELDEKEEAEINEHDILALGIDIGTTTISAVILNLTSKKQIEFFSLPNNSHIDGTDQDLSEHDADVICQKAVNLSADIVASYPQIKIIGVTGQMHGVLYIDKNGNAVSPLINWQDKRGDRICKDGVTYCEKVFDLTGEKLSTGYGFATLYYNSCNGLVPENAYSICSIMDYVAMKLTGTSLPIMHNSVAASYGLFDLKQNCFKADIIEKLGITGLVLPKVTDDYAICGEYSGIPVSVAIGDNQASILGSVKNVNNSVLVNIGTGSQISALAQSFDVPPPLEIRPLVKGKYIQCYSALCGGDSYALLEKFFRAYVNSTSGNATPQYEYINKLAIEAYDNGNKPLIVNTSFRGKRHCPDCKGSITNITASNFTPGNLALGFLTGICSELYEYFEGKTQNVTTVVASGNAIQKLPIYKNILENLFGLPVQISATKEEASVGAVLFACIASGIFKNEKKAEDFISYK
ncbi:MAG: FGGY family carbohydrate kinase [Acutalibacteraceae bacterium]|nr:FGGY family carbohydrate kinase [Acutalibacteraceae bacterium]